MDKAEKERAFEELVELLYAPTDDSDPDSLKIDKRWLALPHGPIILNYRDMERLH